jgi:hypothetical protein
LIWLKNANCFGARTLNNALSDCNGLADGQCGLSDASNAGDWRLPNVKELLSIVHYGYHDPAVPNTAGTGYWTEGDPFSNVQNNVYWTSSSNAGNTSPAWGIQMQPGTIVDTDKTGSYYLWPVRGGH